MLLICVQLGVALKKVIFIGEIEVFNRIWQTNLSSSYMRKENPMAKAEIYSSLASAPPLSIKKGMVNTKFI